MRATHHPRNNADDTRTALITWTTLLALVPASLGLTGRGSQAYGADSRLRPEPARATQTHHDETPSQSVVATPAESKQARSDVSLAEVSLPTPEPIWIASLSRGSYAARAGRLQHHSWPETYQVLAQSEHGLAVVEKSKDTIAMQLFAKQSRVPVGRRIVLPAGFNRWPERDKVLSKALKIEVARLKQEHPRPIESISVVDREGTSGEFQGSVRQVLQNLPFEILQDLANYSFELKPTMSDGADAPASFRDERSWDQIAGLHRGRERKIFIAEQALLRGDTDLRAHPNRTDDVIMHEVGHRLDDLIGSYMAAPLQQRAKGSIERKAADLVSRLGISSAPEFVNAHSLDVQNLSPSRAEALFTFTGCTNKQTSQQARRESFASAFEVLMLGPESRSHSTFVKEFPNTLEATKSILRDHYGNVFGVRAGTLLVDR